MRIVIVGGGSRQWTPKLLLDMARTDSLSNAQVVLQDIDPSRLPLLERYASVLKDEVAPGMSFQATTQLSRALEGADFVIVSISTGGLDAMVHDLEIPRHYGIFQTVGDTVGPGGVLRALRNVPVMLGIAREMERYCPEAWLLNLTNPMSALCRVVAKETRVRIVGLCHELSGAMFVVSLLLGLNVFSLRPKVAGVNHLPVVASLEADGQDVLALLTDFLKNGDFDEELPRALYIPELTGHPRLAAAEGQPLRKRDVVEVNQVKFELLEHTGALPGAGDRHLVEFFPGFLTPSSQQGQRWGVTATSIEDRRGWEAGFEAGVEHAIRTREFSSLPSGEVVHLLIDSLVTGTPRELPLNVPNDGQCPDLPDDCLVECICQVGETGIRPAHVTRVPPLLAEQLRRVVASQELTVRAAIEKDERLVVDALLTDPLAGRIDWRDAFTMAREMLEASAPWLPGFSF